MNQVRASHILVKQKFEAEDLLKKISDGDSFESLAKQFSQCPSGNDGGNLGTFGRGQMVAPFEQAAFALQVGEVSQPVQTQFGYHLIRRDA